MKKIIIIIAIAVGTVTILWFLFNLLSGLFIGGFFFPPITQEGMEKHFQNDKEYIFVVNEYLVNSKYGEIYIPSTMESGEMSNAGTPVKINETEVVTAINTLKKRGYSVIGKDGNTIHFQRWSNLDNGRGVAYSVNGNEPTLQFLTKLEPLTEPNWYYYEENYNEWRTRNVTNGIPNYIIGVWNIQYAKTRGAGTSGEDYSLQDLYGTGIEYGGKLTFNADGTFSRYVGITTDETDKYEGTYILRYDDKILLKYKDGTERTVKYLHSSQEIVYYTWDSNQIPIDEYYIKAQ